MDDLVAFLAARLAEEWKATRDWELGQQLPESHWTRQVEAMRNIVRRCEGRMNEMDVHPNGLVSPRALLARQTLMDLAAIWSGHPDYRPEWKP